MKVFTTLPQDDLKKVSAAAQAAESAGYDELMTMENRHDPFLPWPWRRRRHGALRF